MIFKSLRNALLSSCCEKRVIMLKNRSPFCNIFVSNYLLAFPFSIFAFRLARSKGLLSLIEKHFGTLAFCRRWVDRLGETKYLMSLKDLCDKAS